jgi:hypothetical protein
MSELTNEQIEEIRTVFLSPNLAADTRDKMNALCDMAAELAALKAEARRTAEEVSSKQAKIDSLMMEYCPDEMTAEQIEEWGKHQVSATVTTKGKTKRSLFVPVSMRGIFNAKNADNQPEDISKPSDAQGTGLSQAALREKCDTLLADNYSLRAELEKRK